MARLALGDLQGARTTIDGVWSIAMDPGMRAQVTKVQFRFKRKQEMPSPAMRHSSKPCLRDALDCLLTASNRKVFIFPD